MIKWDDEKINYLRDNYNNMNDVQLSEIIGCSRTTIKVKMNELSLHRQNKIKRRNDYGDEEINYIKENYKKYSYKELAVHIGRTISSVSDKIIELGLENKSNKWTESEVENLTKYFPIVKIDILQESYFPNHTKDSIQVKANQLKIYKSIGNKKFSKQELIKMLKDYANKIGRTPIYSELINNDELPSLSTYSRYFGSYEKACVEADLETNICIYGKYTKS